MLWEVALVIMALTFMIVNIWSVIINTMMLRKTIPFMDRFMKIADKSLNQLEELFDESDED